MKRVNLSRAAAADLDHADQKAREQDALEHKILAGLDSPARKLTAKDWKALRATLTAKLGKRKKAPQAPAP